MPFESIRDDLTFVSARLEFDKQRGDYCAEVGRSVVRAERASDLERKLRRELARGLGLKWARAIIFEAGDPARFRSTPILKDGVYVSAAFGFTRGEVATRSDEAILFRGWPPEDFDEDLPEGLNPPDLRTVSILRGEVFVQAYSDAAWKAFSTSALLLARVKEAIDQDDADALLAALNLKAFLKSLEPPPLPKEEP